MIFVQDSLGAQEADTVQHVISAAGAPQDTLGSRVDLQAVSETVTGAEGMPIPYSPRTDDGLAMILLGCFFVSAYVLARSKKFLLQQVKDFMLHRERTSIFASSTAADMRYLLLLIVQTAFLEVFVFLTILMIQARIDGACFCRIYFWEFMWLFVYSIFCLNGFYIRFWDGCFLTKAKPIYGWSLILR